MVTDNSEAKTKMAPYAPPATVLDIVRHYRNSDVPQTLTKEKLIQIGVKDGLLNRTWSTLVFLGLILEDGTTTSAFNNLRLADDERYPEVLRQILRDAYADIFEAADPETADQSKLDAAFRPYTPGGQRSRMITLFLGLVREAGINTKVVPKERRSSVSGGTTPRKAKATDRAGTQRPPKDQNKNVSKPGQSAGSLADQYFKFLMERAKETEGADLAGLLDRMERLLKGGEPPSG